MKYDAMLARPARDIYNTLALNRTIDEYKEDLTKIMTKTKQK